MPCWDNVFDIHKQLFKVLSIFHVEYFCSSIALGTQPSDIGSDIPVTEIMTLPLHKTLINHIGPLVWHHRRNRYHSKRQKLFEMKHDIMPGTRPRITTNLQLSNRLWQRRQRYWEGRGYISNVYDLNFMILKASRITTPEKFCVKCKGTTFIIQVASRK